MLKLLIAGSRSISDYKTIKDALDEYIIDRNNIEIVSGGALGVDQSAERYARDFMIKLKIFPADWATHGKSAGFRRNEEMGNYADQLFAIYDGESPGTTHMINYMKKLNKEVNVLVIIKRKD